MFRTFPAACRSFLRQQARHPLLQVQEKNKRAQARYRQKQKVRDAP